MKNNPAIVVIAYNRPTSLKRLLGSIGKAQYKTSAIPLIISIDKNANNTEVFEIAQNFEWNHGPKTVNYNEVNLGLRKHVIQCGNLSNEYGSVILLEDDLYVSTDFYNYACQALEFASDNESIGGISLYKHQLNVNNRWHFSVMEDGFDNWYFQFASSWGQAWTQKQWNNFYDWYVKNQKLAPSHLVPANVTRWSSKSWLKYFIYFLVEKDRYFLYPKISLTTNFSDQGTHVKDYSTTFQVPLQEGLNKKYVFSNLYESNAIYDVFYESRTLYKLLKIDKEDLCIDLQGTKSSNDYETTYLLSTKILDYKIEKAFGCRLKPIEANVLNEIDGNSIFLYKTAITSKNPYRKEDHLRIMYNIKHLSFNDTKLLFKWLLEKKVKSLFKKILR